MPLPAVSIIVPCFNGAGFLPACVESILTQGCDAEVIVVDDGSTDDSPAIARQLAIAHPGRLVFAAQANAGQAAARNLGIRIAQGKYLGFLDVDDRYAPGFLARAAAVLDQHPGAVAVQGKVEFVDLHRPVEPWQRQAIESTIPGTILVREETVRQTGGFPTDPAFRGKVGGEDGVFRLELPKFGDVLAIDHPALRYRVRPGSHFDFFLNRSTFKDGRVGFGQDSTQEADGTFQRAVNEYRSQVAGRMIGRMTQLIQTEATAGANLSAYEQAFSGVPGEITAFQGFSLYTLAKRWPVAGVSLHLGANDFRSICWLAAGCKAGSAGKLAIPVSQQMDRLLRHFRLEDSVEPITSNVSELAGAWNRPIRILAVAYPWDSQYVETLMRRIARDGLLVLFANPADGQFQRFSHEMVAKLPNASFVLNHPNLTALVTGFSPNSWAAFTRGS
jgi:glycosyl transferase family 2